MSSINNIFRQTNPYEKFVQQLVQLESQTKFKLEAQQKDQQEQKKALGDVSSSITSFINQIKELSTPTNNAFEPFVTTSNDESIVEVNSATGMDRPSNFNIQVERMATNDTALTGVLNADDYDLAQSGDGSVTITIGEQTETIQLETTKDDGTGTMVDKTNREIFESFTEQLDTLFGDKADATVFNVNNDQIQLSVKSLETGFENRIQFDGATGVGTDITGSITHLRDQNLLDAEFTIDGVTFTRSQNLVDDAIDGLSFTLKGESPDAIQISAQRDLEEAKSNVDEFISSFNDMNKTIRQRTFIDGENNSQGPLRRMRSIRNLTVNLRQTALLPMDGADPDQLSRLSEIGIDFKNDGTMFVDDEELLNEALEQRPEQIAELFTNENSAVQKMMSQAEAYTKSNGIISSLESGVEQKIDRLDNRIAQQDKYLAQYEERQRDMFNKLQLVIQRGDAQFQEVMSFRQRF
jgi:flagellar hook-associated protein 2